MNPSSLISEKLLRFRQKLDEGEVLMVKFERLDCGENSSVLVRRGAKPAGSANLRRGCLGLESKRLLPNERGLETVREKRTKNSSIIKCLMGEKKEVLQFSIFLN